MIEKIGTFCLLIFLSGSILLFIACNEVMGAVLSRGVGMVGFFLLVTSPIGMAISALTHYSNDRKVAKRREQEFFEMLHQDLSR